MKRIMDYIDGLSLDERVDFLVECAAVFLFIAFNILNIIFPYTDSTKLNLIFFAVTTICGVNLYKNHAMLIRNPQMTIGSRGDIEKESPLTDMWKDAKSIDVAAVSCVSYAMRERALFEECLHKHVSFRIVVMNPDCTAYEEHFAHKLKAPESKSYLEPSKNAISSLVESAESCNADFESKLTDINLPYSIMIVEKDNPDESFIKVDVYSINVASKDRPCILIRKSDFKKYDFFKEQFNSIWRDSSPYPKQT